MYYFKNGYTVKIDNTQGDEYCYNKRKTEISSLPTRLINVIPTEQYKTFLDIRLEKPEENINALSKETIELEIGKLYQISPNRVYKLEKIVSLNGLDLNIVSVYSGEKDTKKTLTQEECKRLGIEPKENLIPLPQVLSLHPYDPNKKEFVSFDLSTYPTSMIVGYENSIRYMILQLQGFKRTTDEDIIETPEGTFLDQELFLVSLKVSVKINIPSMGNTSSWAEGDEISWSMITENFKGSNRVDDSEICDTNDNIYVIIKTVKNGKGISPFSLKNKKAGDIFEISWDSSFSVGPGIERKDLIEFRNEAPAFKDNIFYKENNVYWRSMLLTKQKYVPLLGKG